MKKLSVLLMSVLLTFSLAGCSGNSNKEKDGEKKVRIGLAQMCNDVSWKTAETDSIKEEADKRGYEIIMTDAQWKMDKHISDIQDLITQQVDYILLPPNDYEGYEGVLQEAKDANIPVLLLDRDVKGVSGEDYVTCISSDFIFEGEECAKWLQTKKDGKMKIVEITGTPGASVTRDRAKGFKDIVEKDGDMEIISSQVGNFNRAEAEKAMTNIIQSTGGDFQAVYCHTDDMAIGVINALKAAGIKPNEDVYILGIDGSKEAKESVKKGELSAFVTCTPYLGSYAIEAVEKLVKGESVDKKIVVSDSLYDSTNIDKYEKDF